MSESPFFSIIVPVYNVQDYLEKCLQSLTQQTFQSCEILLIDDGSTDQSPQICQKYATAFPDKINFITQENQGVSAARNAGLDQAKGQYILFVDSDDYVANHHLDILHQQLKTNQFFFAFNEIYFDNDGTLTRTHYGKKDKNKIISLTKSIEYCTYGMGFLGILVNKVFSNAIIQANHLQLDETIHQREDRLFCIDYLLAVKRVSPDAKAVIIDDPTYYYVKRSTSQMNQINAKTFSALSAQAQIEEKTNSISPKIKSWNKNKSINDVLFLYSYTQHHPEILDKLDQKILSVLAEKTRQLTSRSISTTFYLLTSPLLSFRHRLKLLLTFYKVKKEVTHL